MLADDYQRRLVESILGTSGAARRTVRDEYLIVLARLIGETPQIIRSDDPAQDIAAIVSWCADPLGGLTWLVEAVATVEEGSAAVDRLRALRSVREPVEVLRPDERALIERLLSELDQSSILALVRDIATRWGPRLHPVAKDPRQVIGLLEDSIAGLNEPHPLYMFLTRLAQQLGNEEIGELAGTVGDRTGTRRGAASQIPTSPDHHYFVVRLAEDGRDASRYLLTVWLVTEDGRWATRWTSDTPQSLDDIKAEVDEQLIQLAEDPVADITDLSIEFIVPRSLLSADLDQWIVTAPGHSSPFGVHYPVVVRDLSRMRNRIIRGRWKRRCGWLHQHGDVAGGTNVDELDGRRQSVFGELMKDPETPACLIVIQPLSYVSTNMSAWLSAGIPVIVWCRNDALSARFNTHVRKPLDTSGIASLPAAVWRLRQDADRPEAATGHVGRHITLLWDCAHRLPPDERPLLQPASVS